MPSGPFAHVCLLVKDLDKAVDDWTKMLRILDPGQLTDPLVRYETFSSGADAGMKWATFVSHHATEIQFIQPAPGPPSTRSLRLLDPALTTRTRCGGAVTGEATSVRDDGSGCPVSSATSSP